MIDDRWSKFYWREHAGDAGLRNCSLAARGLWMGMLCLMHDGQPYGHLTLNGAAPSTKKLAISIGAAEGEVKKLLEELETAGAFSRDANGTIFCRRMVRDRRKSEQARRNGAAGGNPILKPEGLDDSASAQARGTAQSQLPLPQEVNQPVNQTAYPNGITEQVKPPDKPPVKAIEEVKKIDIEEREKLSSFVTNSAREPAEPKPDPRQFVAEATALLAKLTGKDQATCKANAAKIVKHIPAGAATRALTILRNGISAPPRQCYLDWHVVAGWLKDGFRDEAIRAAVQRVASRPNYKPPAALRYFDEAVREQQHGA